MMNTDDIIVWQVHELSLSIQSSLTQLKKFLSTQQLWADFTGLLI